MRTRTFEDHKRISPARTVAMAAAIAVHVGALLLMLSPPRPADQAQLDPPSTDVIMIDPPIPPPPPPPAVVLPDPPPPTRRPQTVPQPRPAIQTPDPVDPAPADPVPDVLGDEPVDDPIEITGPGSAESSEARADARYGEQNHVRYPALAVRKREQGEVQLRVLVGSDGMAQQVELERSSGSRVLDTAAMKAVRAWRFVAAERNGTTVASWAIVPIRFDLSAI